MTKVNADAVRDLFARGYNTREVASILGVSAETVRYHAIKDHIRNNNHCSYPLKPITESFRKEVLDLMAQGFNRVYIANKLERNIHDIFRASEGDAYFQRFNADDDSQGYLDFE